MIETDLMNTILMKLWEAGHTAFRINVGGGKLKSGQWFTSGAPKGHSDIYGFRRDGHVFYIEVKLVPFKPTSEQKAFLRQMDQRGAYTGVAYSVADALQIAEGGHLWNIKK